LRVLNNLNAKFRPIFRELRAAALKDVAAFCISRQTRNSHPAFWSKLPVIQSFRFGAAVTIQLLDHGI
jgi:hypothetical protein